MNFRSTLFGALACVITGAGSLTHAADRAAAWKKVREAVENKQAQTVLDLLQPLETAAFDDQAWGEGTKALLMRVRIQNGLGFPEPVFPDGKVVDRLTEPEVDPFADPFAASDEADGDGDDPFADPFAGSDQAAGDDPFADPFPDPNEAESDGEDPGGLPGCVRQLETEIPAVPAPVRPVLRWFQARWLLAYAERERGEIDSREKIPQRAEDRIERWNAPRINAAIEGYFRQALDDPALRATPVEAFREILGPPGAYGDSLRPTLYDLAAHSLADFLTDGPFVPWDRPLSDVPASSQVFGGADEFLAWKPAPPASLLAETRALTIHQQLMDFHRADPDRSAFLHCDLERLRWAGRFACGGDKPKRQLAAIQAFIKENASHPLSADARHDEVLLLQMANRTTKAHASAKTGAEAFPNHPSGKVCKGLMLEMEARELRFNTPKSWPTSGDEITVKQRNIKHLWFRLCRREWKPNLKTLEEELPPSERKDMHRWLKQRPAYASWDTALNFPQDYRHHPLTVPTPAGLTPGSYLLLVSDDADFAESSIMDWTGIWISDLRIESQGLVVHAATGVPCPDTSVEVWLKPEKAAPFRQVTRTDADGRFTFETKGLSGNGRILVIATCGNDLAVSHGSIRTDTTGAPPSPPASNESVTFFTDRSIYRPGQPIQFKGILAHAEGAKADYHTIADRSVTVTLTGPKDQKIASGDFRTNAMGSFAGTFTAPTDSLLGQFAIKAGELGEEAIYVEEYKRPKFEVKIAPPEKPVELGGMVTLKGTAMTYTGAPVDGAEVEWEVTRDVYFNGWGSWLGWNDNPRDSNITMSSGTLRTGADGSFAITFRAEPDGLLEEDKDPAFQFAVAATVIDPTGETHTAERYLNAAYTQFHAGIEMESWQESGKPVLVKVGTHTHDGDPFPATGTVRVYQLKQPAICPRSEEAPYDENSLPTGPRPGPAGWDVDQEIRNIPVTTKRDGMECVTTVPIALGAGCYRVVFESLDANQRKATAISGVHVIDLAAKIFPTKTPFFVAASAQSVEPGQPISVVWGSGHEVARAFIEWYSANTLLKREWSEPGRTQQVFTFTPDEMSRGGIVARVRQFSGNRKHNWDATIHVPWSNKNLTVKWERITSKLEPGAKDTWTAVISTPDGKAPHAEMVATLYDASLDSLYEHGFGGFSNLFRKTWFWSFRQPESWYSGYHMAWGDDRDGRVPADCGEIKEPFRTLLRALDEGRSVESICVHSGGRFLDFGQYSGVQMINARPYDRYEPPELPNSVGSESQGSRMSGFPVTPATPSSPVSPEEMRAEALRRELAKIVSRGKLHETAFFFPQLATDKDGRIRMTFTMPEGLGRWRFLGFAHDQELRSGHLEGETVTAKDLMVQPNPPRFLREGDEIDFTVRISNQSDRDQSGLASFTLTDAGGATDLTAALGVAAPEQPFAIPARQSRTLAWRITVPDGCGFLRYQARAAGGDLTDGEEGWLPVLPRRVPVTDSLALRIRGAGEVTRSFTALGDSGGSDTLRHESLQVQVVSRPAWYAVMALPYLMEFPHECAEQTFSRLYANALGHRLVTSDPKIRRVFEVWRGSGTLDSPLAKNQDLAGMMLEETPWLRDAADDSSRRRRVGMLFDDNRMTQELASAHAKLAAMQLPGGMWPWFPGGRESEFITAHIVAGFGELRAAGVEVDVAPALRAAAALDGCLTEYHRQLLRAEEKHPGTLESKHLDPITAHLLYSRSFFLTDQPPNKADSVAHRYFLGQARQHWAKLGSRMTAAQLALALWRDGDQDTARLITRAFRETAVNRPETGMSWPTPPGGGWWWDAPVEAQAMMIAAFAEIDRDAKAVDDCRAWLIEQHRDGDWQTTTATAAAVHALLAGPVGDSPLASDALVRVALGGKALEPGGVEPGTGYYECKIPGPEVTPQMAAISLTKTDPGVAWASMHWRYFEDVSKLASHESGGLKIEKHLLVRRPSPTGPRTEPLAGPLRPGDELVTRLVVTSARELEFVHLKDERGSGTEPANALSGYRWGEGVGYYEVTRDAATHFFIDRLPKGVHVFEHSSRIQHAGIYQTGAATIRCMYAPEFMARSGSIRIESARE